MIKARVNSYIFENVTVGPVSGDERQIQSDIGNPPHVDHITIYFDKDDAKSFRDKVKITFYRVQVVRGSDSPDVS